jgi:hypothetical protein
MATVRILYSNEGNQRKLNVTSADKCPPSKKLRDTNDYCSSSRK